MESCWKLQLQPYWCFIQGCSSYAQLCEAKICHPYHAIFAAGYYNRGSNILTKLLGAFIWRGSCGWRSKCYLVCSRRQVYSGFNIAFWYQYLEHYEDKIVVDFLRFGWPINFHCEVFPISTFRNQPSATSNSDCLSVYIAKDLAHWAVLGPFPCNPLSANCVVSPLMWLPKRDSTERRIVHDLSFLEISSVSDGISSDHYLDNIFQLRLPGIDGLVEFVNAKVRGCHVFKKDLRPAFRQILVDPTDYHLLGMSVNDALYFHTSLPFGLGSATLICQRTTKSAVYILNNEGISVDVYIDDFYGAELPACSKQFFQRMNSLFAELCLMASPEKDVSTYHRMLCLGIWIDTLNMFVTSILSRHWIAPGARTMVGQIQVHKTRNSAAARKTVLCVCLHTSRSGIYVSSFKRPSLLCFMSQDYLYASHWWDAFRHWMVAVFPVTLQRHFSYSLWCTLFQSWTVHDRHLFLGHLFRRVFSPCGGLTGIFVPDLVPCISRVHRKEHDNSIRRVRFVLWTLQLGSIIFPVTKRSFLA